MIRVGMIFFPSLARRVVILLVVGFRWMNEVGVAWEPNMTQLERVCFSL